MYRPHKYGAKKTTLDGITFDSKAEAREIDKEELRQKHLNNIP